MELARDILLQVPVRSQPALMFFSQDITRETNPYVSPNIDDFPAYFPFERAELRRCTIQFPSGGQFYRLTVLGRHRKERGVMHN